MTTMSLDSQIKSIYPSLTKTEKKVADYTLKHLKSLNTKTLSEMSKAIHVGEATIMRFVYKLGYESLAQFKVEIIKESIKDKDDSEVFMTLVKVLAEKDRDELFYNFLNVRDMPPAVTAILEAMLFD